MPEMARSSWMQWKAKDMVNAQKDIYGVANIVIYDYNERLLKCCGSRGIGVPEQKSDIVKTRKMERSHISFVFV